jgi:hypothetical protein
VALGLDSPPLLALLCTDTATPLEGRVPPACG